MELNSVTHNISGCLDCTPTSNLYVLAHIAPADLLQDAITSIKSVWRAMTDETSPLHLQLTDAQFSDQEHHDVPV